MTASMLTEDSESINIEGKVKETQAPGSSPFLKGSRALTVLSIKATFHWHFTLYSSPFTSYDAELHIELLRKRVLALTYGAHFARHTKDLFVAGLFQQECVPSTAVGEHCRCSKMH